MNIVSEQCVETESYKGSRDYHIKKEKCDTTYIWNLKNDTNLFAKQKQTHIENNLWEFPL